MSETPEFKGPHPFVTDTWMWDDDPEDGVWHSAHVADVTRAANGIKVISRIVHNSLGQPDMSGAQPLDVGSIQHLMNALECLGDYVFEATETMRDIESRRAEYERQRVTNLKRSEARAA